MQANSFDYSRDDIRSELSDKSGIFRQLKEETVIQLHKLITAIIQRSVLGDSNIIQTQSIWKERSATEGRRRRS